MLIYNDNSCLVIVFPEGAMDENDQDKSIHRPAGYAALIKRYDLDVIPNWHRSFVATTGTHRIDSTGGVIEEIYPSKYWPGDTLGDHLEFALKYDGTNLAILASLFQEAAEKDILEYVQSKPTGKYARRLWFLYEFLTGKTLPLDDLKRGNYIDLLEPDEYYTVIPARQVRRQRINDNLLGDSRFCPTVRRTDTLRDFETADLPKRCRQVVSAYSPELLKRALGYLYTKETKSSFEIEHIKPTSTRTERFVALLQLAEQEDFCGRTQLIELQNRIVDPRFRDSDYRLNQNYVGETVAWQREKIHFACPKPEDLADLMEGLSSRPQAHGRRQCVRRDSCRRHRLWIRFSAPVRGRQRSNPPLPDPQHSCPTRLYAQRSHVPHIGVHAEKPCRL